MTDPPDALSKGCERLARDIYPFWEQAHDTTLTEAAKIVLASDPGLAGLVEAALEARTLSSKAGVLARAALRRFTDG